ncbi:MAG: ABC transporter permease [Opitutaceae bacterium]
MRFWSKLKSLVGRKKLEAEMTEEMRAHLEMQTQVNRAAGMSSDEAGYAARRQFGGMEQLKEQCRDERRHGWLWLEHFAQDLRYAAGSLRRNPIFSLTAVLTLVLGLGATTTIFTLVDTVVWRPLPYAEPHRMVESFQFNRQALRDWSEVQQVVDRIETYQPRSMVLSREMEATQIRADAVSPGLIELLGRPPAIGRSFGKDDAVEGNQFVILLSHGFWQRHFGGDPEVVGRKITLDDRPYTVIGVMPRGFGFRRPSTAAWIPLLPATSESALKQRVEMIARLRPGLGLEAARAAVTVLNRQLNQSHPQPETWGVGLMTLDQTRVNSGPRQMMMLTLGAVMFVLLIACANVANLLLVRATVRQREFAVRAALGAGRARLIRQVLTESLMLVAFGALGGLLLAQWAVQAIWRLAPEELRALTVNAVGIDWRVMTFAIGLVGLAALICGLVPALRASRLDANQTLGSARAATPTRGQRRWQQGFVVVQTALAFVLLVGAGLLLRGFLRVNAVSPGFEVHNLAALSLTLPSKRYPSPAQRQDFYERLRERVAGLPGVAETTLAVGVPPSGGGFGVSADVEIEERPPQKLGPGEFLPFNTVADDYFRVMRIPIVRGRSFDLQDVPGGPPAIIINDRMAGRFWPGADPIGQRVRFSSRQPWMIVVGVAGDVKARGPSDENGNLEYYDSMRQRGYGAYSTLVVRTAGDPRQLDRTIRNEVTTLDPRLPIASFSPAERLMAETLAVPRFCLGLMTGFAGVALVLAAIGLYGVMSYTVAQRTQEIGVRIALGGAAGDIMALVTRSGLALTGVGLTVGILAAAGLTRFLQTMLFEISPLDPATFVGVAAILALIGIAACYVPARRAAKVDPVVALRSE